jgi:ribosomal protein S18 acetylase RimI-like enzyme
MFIEPSREAVAMAGSGAAAERFRAELVDHALAHGTSTILVAELGSELVGFAEISRAGGVPPLRVVARCAVIAMGFAGALASAWRSLARLRVEIAAPKGGIHLFELQVTPLHRNRGVGADLLARVDELAIEQRAAHVSLTTATDNPARRLYERAGYTVVAERTSRRYERITGSAGRVLMVKPMAVLD